MRVALAYFETVCALVGGRWNPQFVSDPYMEAIRLLISSAWPRGLDDRLTKRRRIFERA